MRHHFSTAGTSHWGIMTTAETSTRKSNAQRVWLHTAACSSLQCQYLRFSGAFNTLQAFLLLFCGEGIHCRSRQIHPRQFPFLSLKTLLNSWRSRLVFTQFVHCAVTARHVMHNTCNTCIEEATPGAKPDADY